MSGGPHESSVPRTRLLHSAHRQPDRRRLLLLEALTRGLYPSILVVAVYLLLAGLTRSGGGFAAGLVVGLGLVLRRLAGGPYELGRAAPLPPGLLLGAGLSLCAGYAVAGLVLTGDVLAGGSLTLGPPLVGELHVPSSLLFELGVATIVVGLVLDVLRTLGAEDTPAQEDDAGAEP